MFSNVFIGRLVSNSSFIFNRASEINYLFLMLLWTIHYIDCLQLSFGPSALEYALILKPYLSANKCTVSVSFI